MKKQVKLRILLGFPIGIAVGFVITMLISLWAGDGLYYPVTPELIAAMGNELRAVYLQTLLCGVMGSGFAATSLIWEIDSWSLAKQTGVFFAAICAIMFPIAYCANWMEHTMMGILSYLGVFAAVFLVIWLAKYLYWKNKIAKMNCAVQENKTKE